MGLFFSNNITDILDIYTISTKTTNYYDLSNFLLIFENEFKKYKTLDNFIDLKKN